MIEIRDLTRSYGPLRALDGVTVSIDSGEIVGLLGPNGAGKSTLIRTAAGLQAPDGGVVLIAGTDLWRDPLTAKQQLGYASEEPSFYEELSAEEYLAFIAAVRAMEPGGARDRAWQLARRFGLDARMQEPVRHFSHGMRKKLSFVAAVLHPPHVLLCDEALEGFDAEAALAAKGELRRLAAAGTAVLFSSHVTETIERLCDRVVLLHRGRVARVMTRPEWGNPTESLSVLERAFLDMVQSVASAS